MRKRIVYTRFDGGVSVCAPTDEIISWMSCGGMWSAHSHGVMERQIGAMIAAGHKPDAARRYAHAVQFGGKTTAEALEIIRDRDCSHLGVAIELWDVENVPIDRWFRDAWRRSHNGGPIEVDLGKAKAIQFRRITDAVDLETRRRLTDIELFDAPVDVDLRRMRERIRQASNEIELRHIWPKFGGVA